jgi:hypothetical protein
MANPFINSSFTLRPSANERDRPELTLRQTEVSRMPKETTVNGNFNKGGRAFKRQRLFMDRSTFGRVFHYECNNDDCYGHEDQYISDDEYETPIIRRRVSSEFPSRHRTGTVSSIGESNFWKSRCLGMQNFCDESKMQLEEAEEDQRQLRQRIRELEEQLLLQTSGSNNDGEICNATLVDRDIDIESNAEGKNNRGNAAKKDEEEMRCSYKKNREPPALVVEIKENHQAVSSCFYLTDGEGLNESYDLDIEEEEEDDDDASMNHFCDGTIDEVDDDRNDINMNQRRG